MAFPAISCGVNAYPLAEAARVSIRAAANTLSTQPRPRRVVWVLFDDRTYRAFESALTDLRTTPDTLQR